MQQPLTSPLVDLFLELCAIPRPPGEERVVADRVTGELDRLGLEWDEDDAAARLGSSTGNIVCRLEPTVAEGVPLLFCAHLDTVPVEGALEPVIDEGIVRNAGGAILGADNKAAVVAMLEAVRRIVTDGRDHAGIELVLTPKEEIGLLGATELDVGCSVDDAVASAADHPVHAIAAGDQSRQAELRGLHDGGDGLPTRGASIHVHCNGLSRYGGCVTRSPG